MTTMPFRVEYVIQRRDAAQPEDEYTDVLQEVYDDKDGAAVAKLQFVYHIPGMEFRIVERVIFEKVVS